MTNRDIIISEFKRIKKLEFIKSNRSHNTGIGKTFEDNLGVDENNLKNPDLLGFEVKTKRFLSESFLTLFTKAPSFPKRVNSELRKKYGFPDVRFPQTKRLLTSVWATKFNSFNNQYGFRLKVNQDNKKIFLLIKLLSDDSIISEHIYWTFEDINKSISRKLKSLFVVYADTKVTKGIEYFHFKRAKVYLNLKFDKFISALEIGIIMIDIRLGVYYSGKNIGKPHDYGTGFRIKKEKLSELYDDAFDIE